MRDHNFFERDFESESAKFFGNIFDGLLCLRRSGKARADIFCEVRDLSIGVVAGERGVAKFREGGKQFWMNRRLVAGADGCCAMARGVASATALMVDED